MPDDERATEEPTLEEIRAQIAADAARYAAFNQDRMARYTRAQVQADRDIADAELVLLAAKVRRAEAVVGLALYAACISVDERDGRWADDAAIEVEERAVPRAKAAFRRACKRLRAAEARREEEVAVSLATFEFLAGRASE